ncbi:MAG: sulfotransferase domain-containing protein [Gammaproteobacteria bacterium]|nr:MAG: sulfotransferase domain-containing protein [Gammaproteobacteria bacterium]
MVSGARLRHLVTKSPLKYPINWIQHRGLQPSDVFVAAYPKSGSTWLRFLIYQLIRGEPGSFERVNDELPDVGYHAKAPGLLPEGARIIKTHEPYRFSYRRALYMVRDPRDIVISEYHYQIWANIITDRMPFDKFFASFLSGKVNRYGAWDQHVASWLKARDDGRAEVHVIRFEDMKRNAVEVLGSVAAFLNIPASSSLLDAIIEANSVQNMRKMEDQARQGVFKNKSTQTNFVRKGKSGGWRGVLSAHHLAKLESRFGPIMERLGYALESKTSVL